jgi:hypothetical protein
MLYYPLSSVRPSVIPALLLSTNFHYTNFYIENHWLQHPKLHKN